MTTYRLFDLNRASRDFTTQFADFHNFSAGDYVITRVGTTPTEAVVSAIGGALLITTSAASGDRDALQWAGGAGAVRPQYGYVAGKKLQFTSRLRVSNALNAVIALGLHSAQTDPIGTPPADAIYFRTAAASARLFFVARKAGVEVALDTQTDLVAATDYDLEFYHDGSISGVGATVSAFINKVRVGSIPVAALPTNLLALSFALQNGTAAANTMQLDYIGAQQQR